MNKDICLYYSGGSGGFLVLHGILLSGVHKADGYDANLNQLIDSLWNSIDTKDLSSWKDSEVWPNNALTESFDTNKIYFTCNPVGTDNDYKYITDSSIINVTVFTDIEMQLRLMRLKHANLYFNNSKANVAHLHSIKNQVEQFKEIADYALDLSDIIKTKFKIVTNTLGIPYNDNHKNLINKWLELHPISIQNLLLN